MDEASDLYTDRVWVSGVREELPGLLAGSEDSTEQASRPVLALPDAGTGTRHLSWKGRAVQTPQPLPEGCLVGCGETPPLCGLEELLSTSCAFVKIGPDRCIQGRQVGKATALLTLSVPI